MAYPWFLAKGDALYGEFGGSVNPRVVEGAAHQAVGARGKHTDAAGQRATAAIGVAAPKG